MGSTKKNTQEEDRKSTAEERAAVESSDTLVVHEMAETLAPDEMGDTVAAGGSLPASSSAHGMRKSDVGRGEGGDQSAEGLLGTTLGSYELQEVLGEGGMGRVYLAEHTKIGRKVALKMLHTHLATSADVVRRFFDEARAVNQIHHEHIIEITDFVENDEGNNYVIMEYLRGSSLSDEIRDCDSGLAIERVVDIGKQVASALTAVHEADIIHRDLKPENIFLTTRSGRSDFVKLLDFGIAKLSGDNEEGVKLRTTEAGVIMGTPVYMSPQQASGEPVDYRADIYSMGIILYEMTTGRLPFKAKSFGELIVMHRTQIPEVPTSTARVVPSALSELIMACLAKDPDERPSSCAEIEAALDAILEPDAGAAAVAFAESRALERSPRNKALLLVPLVAAVLAALLFFTLGGKGSADSEAEKGAAAAQGPSKDDGVELGASMVETNADADVSPAKGPGVDPGELTTRDAIDASIEPVDPPETIELQFSSKPTGAMVYLVSEEKPTFLGLTPFSLEVEKRDVAQAFEFRKRGYDVELRSHRLTQAGMIEAALRSQGHSGGKSHAGGKDSTHKGANGQKVDSDGSSNVSKDPKDKNDPMYKEGAVMNPFDKTPSP